MTTSHKNIFKGIGLILLIIGTVWVIRQNATMPYQRCQGIIFGTSYHITYQWDKDLQGEIEKELKLVDESLSPFNKKSLITKINQNEKTQLNEMFLTVYDLAQRVSEETDGAFDITVAPLVNVWGFGFKHDTNPTTATIDSLRQFVGYKSVHLIGKSIRKDDPRTQLDCSAIAKGYGVDRIAGVLRKHGVKNFLVEIGGEIVAEGISEKKNPWHVGITKPVDDSLSTNTENQAVLEVTDFAMATSGNYRNFYYKDGKKYAHTIDPRTGYPVQHNILSATVIAPSCAMADAYATSFMVMGLEEAKRFLDEHSSVKAYIIYDDHGTLKTWVSKKLNDAILR